MISIVICSINKTFLLNISKNIEETIGLPFEILSFDNSISKRSLASVYNDLGNKAKFDIISFIHEDVIFHTKGWGIILVKLLTDKNIGLIGISGATYKSKYPGTWSTCDKVFYRTHSIQHFKGVAKPVTTNINPDNALYAKVAVIDGVFMSTSKKVFAEFKFDEKLLKKFHSYDLDFSLQIGSKYDVIVSYEILIEHMSEGTLDADWLNDSIELHKKWESVLPLNVGSKLYYNMKTSDYKSCCNMLNTALKASKIKIILKYYFLCISKFFF